MPPKSKNICQSVFIHIAISALISSKCIRYAPAINKTVRAVRSFDCPIETDQRGQPLTKSLPNSTRGRETTTFSHHKATQKELTVRQVGIKCIDALTYSFKKRPKRYRDGTKCLKISEVDIFDLIWLGLGKQHI